VIAVVDVAEFQAFGVNACDHAQTGLAGAFEDLYFALEGQLAQFVLGSEGLVDLFIGEVIGVVGGEWGEVAATSLERPIGFAGEADLQRVIFAVEIEVTGGKAENVRDLGLRGELDETLIEIVAIVKELATGAVGDGSKDVLHDGFFVLAEFRAELVDMLPAGGVVNAGSVKTTGIGGVDDDADFRGAVDQVVLFASRWGNVEAGGNHDDDALAGKNAHASNDRIEVAQRDALLLLALGFDR